MRIDAPYSLLPIDVAIGASCFTTTGALDAREPTLGGEALPCTAVPPVLLVARCVPAEALLRQLSAGEPRRALWEPFGAARCGFGRGGMAPGVGEVPRGRPVGDSGGL